MMHKNTSANAQSWIRRLTVIAAGSALFLTAASAQATIIYDSWTTNAGISGNYRVEVTENNDDLDFFVTVDPWNAELLGIFVDLGDIDVGLPSGIAVSNVTSSPGTGDVTVFGTDTNDTNGPTSCGPGCNLNEGGIGITLPPDGQWEFIFRLGTQGYEGIQTFSWTVNAPVALSESMLGFVGVRSQVLCSGTDTLPANQSSCGGSDMSVGSPTMNPPPPVAVPEPTSLALLGIGLIGFTVASRRRRAQ